MKIIRDELGRYPEKIIDNNLLMNYYLINKKSSSEIARIFNISNTTAWRKLKKLNIKFRDKSECQKGLRMGNKHFRYKPENHNIISICQFCGKKIHIESFLYGNKRCHSCAMKERWKNKTIKIKYGKEAINWKGGKTKLVFSIRTFLEMKEWRNKIFKRDNYTCQICYKRGIKLEAHHKIPINIILDLYLIHNRKDAIKCKLLWDINWGITLCKDCHDLIPKKG